MRFPRSLRLKISAFALLLASASCSVAQELTISAAKVGGVYAPGEKISWHVTITGDKADEVQRVGYVLRKGGLTEVGKGELVVQNHSVDLQTQLDEPGTLLAEFTALPTGDKPITGLAGAMVEPEKIGISAPCPADFDAFWKSKVDELLAVPANPVLKEEESGNDKLDYWKITLDNIRGTHIQGQLARPKAATQKLPAILLVQSAGVYPLAKNRILDRAREGWLALNLNAHDLPTDMPEEWYKEKQRTDPMFKDYPGYGNDDREQSYFLRMYLSCYRAVDYLAGRDDWDGKTLVVMGTSQGGLQAIMTGGLHPKVTGLLANVPAGCDHSGPLVGRRAGWPQWYEKVAGKDAAKVAETSKYFDVANFARHVQCPALVSVGLIDTTCPAAGVVATFNQIQGKKELVVMPKSDHHGNNNSQAAYNARSKVWLQSFRTGMPTP
ncbi:hypothetical protein EON83_16910 [bacterium]|nr:MAG: hypothetical protein EON83_16910 [bacterium]